MGLTRNLTTLEGRGLSDLTMAIVHSGSSTRTPRISEDILRHTRFFRRAPANQMHAHKRRVSVVAQQRREREDGLDWELIVVRGELGVGLGVEDLATGIQPNMRRKSVNMHTTVTH